jgi:alkanesulfonate monooxygenase SsuD/methylene tetrahydromethanopterin reductase-like flavin-dependent oxidoreductase (luciferase family)
MMMNPERYDELQKPYLEEGFAKAGGGKSIADFDVCPGVSVIVTDEPEKARVPVKMGLALYIGGMGARDKNFYNDYARRMGYEAEAKQIQDLFLDGKRGEAMAAVPDRLVDDVHLVGSEGWIRDRLSAWREAGKKHHVDSMLIGTSQPEALELLAKELL